MKKKEKKELEKFFDYILDKVEDCYKKEVEIAINGFLKETVLEIPVQEQHKFIPSTSEGICTGHNCTRKKLE